MSLYASQLGPHQCILSFHINIVRAQKFNLTCTSSHRRIASINWSLGWFGQMQGWMLGVEGDLVEGMFFQKDSRQWENTAHNCRWTAPWFVWRCKLTSLCQLNQYMSSWTLRLAKLQTDPIDEATIEHQSMLQFLMNICLQGFSRTVATTHSFFTSSIERARGSKVLARPLRHHDWLYLGDLVSPLNKLSNSSQPPRCFLNMKFYLGQTNRFKTPAPPVPLQPFNHLAISEIECQPLRPCSHTSNFIIQ